MKPILSVLALCVLAACSQQQSTSASGASTAAVASAREAKPTDLFEQFSWLNRQTQAELANATPEQADKIYLNYRNEVKEIIKKLNEQEKDFLDHFFDEENWQGEEPVPALKNKQKELAQLQLEYFDMGEMMVEIRPIPAYEVSLFADKVTPATKQFIETKANDDKELVFVDAAVIVEWQDLGKRVAAWEQFIQQNPQHPLLSEAVYRFEMYADAYLFGSDNTPVVNVGKADAQLADIDAEYQKIDQEWQRFAQQNPNSKLTPLFAQVRELVKKNNEEGFELVEQFKQKHFPSLFSEHMNVEEVEQ